MARSYVATVSGVRRVMPGEWAHGHEHLLHRASRKRRRSFDRAPLGGGNRSATHLGA